MTTIPPETAGIAAVALHESIHGAGSWRWVPNEVRERKFRHMSAALTAARPHIEAAIRADERERIVAEICGLGNPNRSRGTSFIRGFRSARHQAAVIAMGERRG